MEYSNYNMLQYSFIYRYKWCVLYLSYSCYIMFVKSLFICNNYYGMEVVLSSIPSTLHDKIYSLLKVTASNLYCLSHYKPHLISPNFWKNNERIPGNICTVWDISHMSTFIIVNMSLILHSWTFIKLLTHCKCGIILMNFPGFLVYVLY